jgi:hypothetical protein
MHWVTLGLGVFIVVVEGIQQLYQFQSNWIAYRAQSPVRKNCGTYSHVGAHCACTARSSPLKMAGSRIIGLVSGHDFSNGPRVKRG